MSSIELLIYDLIIKFGFPFVLICLIFKGLLIGKFIPATTLISTYMIISGNTEIIDILMICLVTSSATTTGETIIFSQCKNPNDKVAKFLPNRVNDLLDKDTEETKISKLLDKFSNNIGLTIFIGNIITGVRGFAAIPAGRNQYNTYKFISISYVSTFIYHVVLTYIIITGFNFIL